MPDHCSCSCSRTSPQSCTIHASLINIMHINTVLASPSASKKKCIRYTSGICGCFLYADLASL